MAKWLDTPADWRAARVVHRVQIGPGLEAYFREPTLAESQQIGGADADAAAEVFAALLLREDGKPVFADAAEAALTLTLDQVEAITRAIEQLSDARAAKKNSPETPAGEPG